MRRQIRTASALLIVLVALSAARSADAGIGIETYEKPSQRPADASGVIEKFERFTLKRGAAISGSRLWNQLPRRPAVQDANITPRQIADGFDQANHEWRLGNVGAAKQLAEQSLQWSQDDVGTATRLSSLPELLTRAYAMFALLASDANDKKAAIGWMIRLKTDIPDHPAIRSKFGADAEKIYNEALTVERTLDHGRLLVRVTNPRAHIFINEVERGSDGSFEGDLPVGDYRIYVTDGSGYRFDRSVGKGRTTQLDVDWQFHTALVQTRDWVGLIIPPETKPHETELRDIASLWLQSTTYYLLSVQDAAGHRYLTGTVYSAKIGVRRSGRILLGDTQEDARMEAFAAFLENGTRSPLIEYVDHAPDHAEPSTPPTKVVVVPQPEERVTYRRSNTPPAYSLAAWVVGGSIMIAGGAIVAGDLDGEPDCIVQCSMKYGIPITAVGLGVYLSGFFWMSHVDQRDADRAALRSVFVVPTSGGAMAGIGGSF